MAAAANNSKLVTPFMPSLQHFSAVKVAIPLYKHIQMLTFSQLFKYMECSNPRDIYEGNSLTNISQTVMKIVPKHLRDIVMEVMFGFDDAILEWQNDHPDIAFVANIKELFLWKSDGKIDRIKTMHQLLLIEEISIQRRYELACSYCLEDTVRSLWDKMDPFEQSLVPDTPFTRFWKRRMSGECGGDWIQEIPEHLHIDDDCSSSCRFDAFFPFLQPKEREKFLSSLNLTSANDFLLCLYQATPEEEVQILNTEAAKLLILYLKWPMRNFFFQMVEKMWDFIDFPAFKKVLRTLLRYKRKHLDFDYAQILFDFWVSSPDHLKEEARTDDVLILQIETVIELVRKRKEQDSQPANSASNS